MMINWIVNYCHTLWITFTAPKHCCHNGGHLCIQPVYVDLFSICIVWKWSKHSEIKISVKLLVGPHMHEINGFNYTLHLSFWRFRPKRLTISAFNHRDTHTLLSGGTFREVGQSNIGVSHISPLNSEGLWSLLPQFIVWLCWIQTNPL